MKRLKFEYYFWDLTDGGLKANIFQALNSLPYHKFSPTESMTTLCSSFVFLFPNPHLNALARNPCPEAWILLKLTGNVAMPILELEHLEESQKYYLGC